MSTMHAMRKKNGRPGGGDGRNSGNGDDVGKLFQPSGRDRGQIRRTAFRKIREGETFEEVLKNEMSLRGHNNEDAAREIPTSPANVSRWLRGVQIPTYGSAQSAQNISNLVRYLRLQHLSDYGTLYLNSTTRRHDH